MSQHRLKNLMKFLFPLWIIQILICNSASAADSTCSHPLATAHYTGFGMVESWDALYAQVCDDGVVRFEDYELQTDATLPRVSKQTYLTIDQLAVVEKALASKAVNGLVGTYSSHPEFRDYSITVAFEIQRPRGTQKFVIADYLSELRDVPAELTKMLCVIDEARKLDWKLSSRNCSAT